MPHVALSRRRVLAVIGGIAILLPFGVRRVTAKLRSIGHQPLPPDTEPLEPAVARSVSLLAGALFGHRLEGAEVAEISHNLEQLMALDGGWRLEYAAAASWLDRRARALGAASFDAADDDARYAIVDELMKAPVDTWRARMLATVDENTRVRRRMRSELVEVLANMYVGSATSWRRRGYARRPGDPGEPREYTRAGVVVAC